MYVYQPFIKHRPSHVDEHKPFMKHQFFIKYQPSTVK